MTLFTSHWMACKIPEILSWLSWIVTSWCNAGSLSALRLGVLQPWIRRHDKRLTWQTGPFVLFFQLHLNMVISKLVLNSIFPHSNLKRLAHSTGICWAIGTLSVVHNGRSTVGSQSPCRPNAGAQCSEIIFRCNWSIHSPSKCLFSVLGSGPDSHWQTKQIEASDTL